MSGAGLTSFIAIWDGRMALTFSRGLLKPLEGTGLHESLQSALHKAASALPPPGLDYVRRMQDSFSVGLGPHKAYRQHRETVARLQQAIEKRRTVQMPLGFDIQAYVRDALVLMRGRPITVDLLFDRQTAAGVKDRAWHPSQVLTPQKQGRLTMTL